MWELDYEESWAPKNWCFWTVVLEKTLESPLDCKEIQSVHPKGNRSWIVIGRTDVEAETSVLWPPDVKSWVLRKDPDAGKDWRQEEKGTTEDEMAGWYHWLNRHGFGWTPGVGDRQGGLACCGSWGCKESDMTEWLNWTKTMTTAYGNIPNLLPRHIFEGKYWSVVCWWQSSLTASKSWAPKNQRPPTINPMKACPRGSLQCLWLNTMVSQLLHCQSLAIQYLWKKIFSLTVQVFVEKSICV